MSAVCACLLITQSLGSSTVRRGASFQVKNRLTSEETRVSIESFTEWQFQLMLHLFV